MAKKSDQEGGVVMMSGKARLVFSLTFVFYILPSLLIIPGIPAQEPHKDAQYQNEKGIEYFNKGFYEALPKKKKEEASRYFEQAGAAFKKAIALNENDVEAHRNLARVYYVQKKFSASALEYRKVTFLVPTDIDAYVLAASAYTKAKDYDQAMVQLKTAKTLIADQAVIQKLDDYLGRIQQKKDSQSEE